MSNLGKVYVINISKKQKDLYPVVYMNKEYIYCKQHGSYELRCFRAPGGTYSRTYSYQEFKDRYGVAGGVNESETYTIYVPQHVKTSFDWIREKSPLEKEIDRLKICIRDHKNQITITELHIRSDEKRLKELQESLSTDTDRLREAESKLHFKEDM